MSGATGSVAGECTKRTVSGDETRRTHDDLVRLAETDPVSMLKVPIPNDPGIVPMGRIHAGRVGGVVVSRSVTSLGLPVDLIPSPFEAGMEIERELGGPIGPPPGRTRPSNCEPTLL